MKSKTEKNRLYKNCPGAQCFREFEPISLTKSQQSYLKSVYEISPNNGGVHISDIAAKLEVTKASSCVAMDVLKRKGLIYRDNNRLIKLTKTGSNQAMMIIYKFNMIRHFLIDILHVSKENSTADAGLMEHYLEVETLCCLCKFLGSAK